MMSFNLRTLRNQPINNTNTNSNSSHLFSQVVNRPKMLYIDIIGNTKPGCKRCGK